MYTHQIHHLFLRPTHNDSLMGCPGLLDDMEKKKKTTKVAEEVSMCTTRWSHVGHLEGLLSFCALLSDPYSMTRGPWQRQWQSPRKGRKMAFPFSSAVMAEGSCRTLLPSRTALHPRIPGGLEDFGFIWRRSCVFFLCILDPEEGSHPLRERCLLRSVSFYSLPFSLANGTYHIL